MAERGLQVWRETIATWPEPWQQQGRRIMGDGHLALAMCRHSQMVAVFRDITGALERVESEMQAAQAKGESDG